MSFRLVFEGLLLLLLLLLLSLLSGLLDFDLGEIIAGRKEVRLLCVIARGRLVAFRLRRKLEVKCVLWPEVKEGQKNQSSLYNPDPNPANNNPRPIFALDLSFCSLLSVPRTRLVVSASEYRDREVSRSSSRSVEVGELD
jgi:hypothetical protein